MLYKPMLAILLMAASLLATPPTVWAQDAQLAKPTVIKFPVRTNIVLPQTITTTEAPLDLYPNQMLVVEGDAPFDLIAGNGEDNLSISEPQAGPIKVRGVFAPAPQGAVSVTRDYTGKFISFVEVATPPEQTTVIRLIAIPYNRVSRNDIKYQSIRLLGKSPTPTPDPNPDPNPNPNPTPTPVPSGDLRVILLFESSANNTSEQLTVLNSTKLYEFLGSNAKEWRKWDKDVVLDPSESKELQAILTNTKPSITDLPAIVIVRGTVGQIHPLPKTPQATIDLIKSPTSHLPATPK